jgi:hypothetical protein
VAARVLQRRARIIRRVSAAIENARTEWEDGSRRLAAARPDARLLAQVETVLSELRRRVGQTFTIAELVEEYERSERWIWNLIEERAATPGWSRNVVLVEQAAFHAYARGALDYAP